VSKEIFNSLLAPLRCQLVYLLLTADNEESNIKAAVASLLRKLPLEGTLVATVLEKMVGESNKKITQKRRTTRYFIVFY